MEKILSNLVLRRPLPPGASSPAPLNPEVVNSIAQSLRRPQLRGLQVEMGGATGFPLPLTIVSIRDQLSVELQAERICIEDESNHDPFSPDFWKITEQVYSSLQWEFKPYGFNFKAAISHPNHRAGNVIAGIFNTDQIRERTGRSLEIGTATVRFFSPIKDDGECAWKIEIEPRFEDPEQDSTYLHGNAHFEKMFNPDAAKGFVEEVFERFVQFSESIVKMGLEDE